VNRILRALLPPLEKVRDVWLALRDVLTSVTSLDHVYTPLADAGADKLNKATSVLAIRW
jgi:hypothetical protein